MKVLTLCFGLFMLVGHLSASRCVIEAKINVFGNRLETAIAKKYPTTNIFFSPLALHLMASFLSIFITDDKILAQTQSLLNINEEQIKIEYEPMMKFIKTLSQNDALIDLSVSSVQCLPQFNDKTQIAKLNPQMLANELRITTTDKCEETTHLVKALASIDIMGLFKKSNQFPPKFTHPAEFNDINGETIIVHTMVQENDIAFKFDEVLKAKVGILEFEKSNLRLVFVCPIDTTTFAKFEAELAQMEDINKVFEKTKVERVTLQVPKFSLKSNFSMNEILSEAGFDQFVKAKFFGKYTKAAPVTLDKIYQSSAITVYEEGMAVVSNLTSTGSAMETRNVMKCDRPFMVYVLSAIGDGNVILFQGRIVTIPSTE